MEYRTFKTIIACGAATLLGASAGQAQIIRQYTIGDNLAAQDAARQIADNSYLCKPLPRDLMTPANADFTAGYRGMFTLADSNGQPESGLCTVITKGRKRQVWVQLHQSVEGPYPTVYHKVKFKYPRYTYLMMARPAQVPAL